MSMRFAVIVCVLVALAAPQAVACTVHDTEEKIHQVVAAMVSMRERDAAKAAAAEQEFEAATERALEVSDDPKQSELKWQIYCKVMDKLLAELKQ